MNKKLQNKFKHENKTYKRWKQRQVTKRSIDLLSKPAGVLPQAPGELSDVVVKHS